MNKIYLLGLLFMASTLSFGQIDLSATMDNHTNLDNTSDDPLNMDFTIRNLGDSLTPMDTIWFAISIGGSYYTTDNLTINTVNGGAFTNGFPNGASFPVDVADLLGSFMTTELGGSTGTICVAVLGVGDSVLTTPFSSDATPLNNVECVTWTDAAGINDNILSQVSVYPNPASSDVTFDLGQNDVDQIQIMDLSGRVIDVINVTNSIEGLSVSNYESGVYFYALIHGGVILKTEKLVVSK
jgi:Secretion system C-terminal sorting domain